MANMTVNGSPERLPNLGRLMYLWWPRSVAGRPTDAFDSRLGMIPLRRALMVPISALASSMGQGALDPTYSGGCQTPRGSSRTGV